MKKRTLISVGIVAICLLILILVCVLLGPRNTTVSYSLDDPALETQIALDILEYTGPNLGDNFLRFESHKVLAVETRQKKDSAKVIVYLCVAYSEYSYSGQTAKNGYGANLPIALTYKKTNGGAYAFVEYWKPGEGTDYSSDIRKMFPEEVVSGAFDQNLMDQLRADCEAKAAAKMDELGFTFYK